MTLTNLSFEQWVSFNFDHHVTKPEWHWNIHADEWEGSPHVSIEYITRAFENPVSTFSPFSDAQVNQGLSFLINEAGGEIYALFAEEVTLNARIRCARSIYTLFDRCLATRCSPTLSHHRRVTNPLNAICYIWWDGFPTWGKPENLAHEKIDEELLSVMKRTLYLDSNACRESALHGLGHWHLNYPNQVSIIVTEFLASQPEIEDELRDYALLARKGRIQ